MLVRLLVEILLGEAASLSEKTNMAAAIKKLKTDVFQNSNGDRPGVPNVAVLVTDGYSSVNPLETIPQAQHARNSGIMLFSVGISLPDIDEIAAITDDMERIIVVDGFDELPDITKSLKETIMRGNYQKRT